MLRNFSNLPRPRFPEDEFSCLNPDLACVGAFLELKECDRQIASCEQDLAEARASRKPALLDSLIDDMQAVNEPNVYRCGDLVRAYRKASNRPKFPLNAHEMQKAATALRNEFARFDDNAREAFEQFFRSHFPQEVGDTGGGETAVKEAEQRLQAARNKRETILLEAASTVFKAGHPPEQFGEHRGRSPVEMTEIVITTFVNEWKARAPLWECECSVGGVAIHSMDTPRRDVWSDAYKKLSLKPNPRNPKLAYLIEVRNGRVTVPAAMREATGGGS